MKPTITGVSIKKKLEYLDIGKTHKTDYDYTMNKNNIFKNNNYRRDDTSNNNDHIGNHKNANIYVV